MLYQQWIQESSILSAQLHFKVVLNTERAMHVTFSISAVLLVSLLSIQAIKVDVGENCNAEK